MNMDYYLAMIWIWKQVIFISAYEYGLLFRIRKQVIFISTNEYGLLFSYDMNLKTGNKWKKIPKLFEE
jgi:hypothetical protein